MNSLNPIVLPALLGLLTGVGHGIFSHYANLPVSLGDQLLQVSLIDESTL